MSELAVEQLIETCIKEAGEWIIQPFYNNEKISLSFYSPSDKQITEMQGRIRITPYYAFESGKILIAKTTHRKNTLLIHGASDSINTVATWE